MECTHYQLDFQIKKTNKAIINAVEKVLKKS